jgi:hypothetical protein
MIGPYLRIPAQNDLYNRLARCISHPRRNPSDPKHQSHPMGSPVAVHKLLLMHLLLEFLPWNHFSIARPNFVLDCHNIPRVDRL